MQLALEELHDPDLEDYCWRLSQGPPPRRHAAGELFRDLRLRLTEDNWHPLAKLGITKDTLNARKRSIKFLRDENRFDDFDAEMAIIETLERLRQIRKWKWSSMLRNMASLQGALKHYDVSLDTPQWKMALRGVAIKAREERPKQAHPATADNVQKAIDNANHAPTAAAIALGWVTCARIGCISQLRKEDVVLQQNGSISVTFRRGKAVRSRGPYTVHSKIPPPWMNLIHNQLQLNNPFLASAKEVRETLRRADRRLEQRSLRRGALQTLAIAGVDENDLLHFSGHTTLAMLRRYLEWGRVNERRAQLQAHHANALAPHAL